MSERTAFTISRERYEQKVRERKIGLGAALDMLRERDETILALRAEVEAMTKNRDRWQGIAGARLVEITDLLEYVEALRGALEPFAQAADGRRAKDIRGSVCFPQKFLLSARAARPSHQGAGEP